jgi:predicted PurR-regulated permease PerM
MAIFMIYLHSAPLLFFAGALLALLLRSVATQLARHLRISVVVAVWLSAAGLFLVGFLSISFLGSAIARQVAALDTTLPAALDTVAHQLRATSLGAWLTSVLPNLKVIIPDTVHLLTGATGVLSGVLSAVASTFIVLFIAGAGALEPALYANGFVQLFPAVYRPKIRELLAEVAHTLRIWLVARFATMAITGTLVTAGLALLHVPLAGALGVLAGLLAFIPNIGAIIAATPAVILAFVKSPTLALAVTGMYVVVHILDDFIIAPLVERQVVKLPPILTLVAQISLGIVAGALGIMLAAPAVAVLIIVVRRLWVEEVANRLREESPPFARVCSP